MVKREVNEGDVAPLESGDPQLERAFRGHDDTVTSLVFHPDGKNLISGSLDATVTMWPFSSGKEEARADRRHYQDATGEEDVAMRFKGHTGPVTSVAVSPNGNLAASGSEDQSVRLWLLDEDSVPGQCSRFKAHNGAVRSVDFSEDGSALLTASDDMSLKVWSVPRAQLVQTLTGHTAEVKTAKLSKDSRLAASGGKVIDETIKIWDVVHGECINTFYHHLLDVNSVAWLSHSMLVSGSDDKSIKLWDLRSRTGVVQQFVDAHEGGVTCVNFHPSGHFVLSSGTDNALKVWDLRRADLFYSMKAHEAATTAVAFSQNGDKFASGSADDQILLWKTNFDSQRQEPEPEPDMPAPDTNWLPAPPTFRVSPVRNTFHPYAEEMDPEYLKDKHYKGYQSGKTSYLSSSTYEGRNWDASRDLTYM